MGLLGLTNSKSYVVLWNGSETLMVYRIPEYINIYKKYVGMHFFFHFNFGLLS